MKKASFHKNKKKVEEVKPEEMKEIGDFRGFLIFEKENEKKENIENKKDSPKIEEKKIETINPSKIKGKKIETIKDSPKIKEKTELISNLTPKPNTEYKNFSIILFDPYREHSHFSEFFEILKKNEINDKAETSKVENENSKPEYIPKLDSLKTSDTLTSISTKNDTFSKCDSFLKNDSIIISDSLSLSSSNNIINQNTNENSSSKKLEESSNSNSLSISNIHLLANNSLTESAKKAEETGADMNLIIDKVISCEDMRTTIMIKNIPNKFNRELLLEIIDQHFKGTYDTFVLPTDVNKYKNFGYSFINFTSSYYIPYFYFIFNKKKWAGTNSKKVCELTYSKVQGKNDLSNHYPSKIIYDNKESKMVTPDQKYIIPNAFKLIFNKCFPNQSIEEYKYYFITKMPKKE